MISFRTPNVYRMFRTEAELAQVRSLPFVTGARPYSIDQTVRPDFLHALEAAEKSAGDDAELLPDIAELLPASGRQDEQAESDREVFHVVCHRAKDFGTVEAGRQKGGGEVLEPAGVTLRLRTTRRAARLALRREGALTINPREQFKRKETSS